MYNYTEIIYSGYDEFNLPWPAFNSNVSRSSGPLDIHIMTIVNIRLGSDILSLCFTDLKTQNLGSELYSQPLWLSECVSSLPAVDRWSGWIQNTSTRGDVPQNQTLTTTHQDPSDSVGLLAANTRDPGALQHIQSRHKMYL